MVLSPSKTLVHGSTASILRSKPPDSREIYGTLMHAVLGLSRYLRKNFTFGLPGPAMLKAERTLKPRRQEIAHLPSRITDPPLLRTCRESRDVALPPDYKKEISVKEYFTDSIYFEYEHDTKYFTREFLLYCVSTAHYTAPTPPRIFYPSWTSGVTTIW
jgi:hypothetical protein